MRCIRNPVKSAASILDSRSLSIICNRWFLSLFALFKRNFALSSVSDTNRSREEMISHFKGMGDRKSVSALISFLSVQMTKHILWKKREALKSILKWGLNNRNSGGTAMHMRFKLQERRSVNMLLSSISLSPLDGHGQNQFFIFRVAAARLH